MGIFSAPRLFAPPSAPYIGKIDNKIFRIVVDDGCRGSPAGMDAALSKMARVEKGGYLGSDDFYFFRVQVESPLVPGLMSWHGNYEESEDLYITTTIHNLINY